MEHIKRSFLEIKSLKELNCVKKPSEKVEVNLVNPPDFLLNKFLYKQIGKNYFWVDRLIWSVNDWNKYVERSDLFTYVMKVDKDLAGFFELIYHEKKAEIEIAYLGLFKEYIGSKLGGYLLTEAIQNSFKHNVNRVWVHTCSLDHKNALNNYISRGMRIYKTETVSI